MYMDAYPICIDIYVLTTHTAKKKKKMLKRVSYFPSFINYYQEFQDVKIQHEKREKERGGEKDTKGI